MLTGDHPATALAIAHEVGLAPRVDATVLTGAELPADDAALGARLDADGIVLARVDPADKLRIARVLQARGHVVAMTGDGVNDGPALREADIGVAMGRHGTDVARESADLVLLDDDFSTIVAAIAQGRATYANIRRFLTYHLTDNVAELAPFVVWALSGGRIPLALTVLQVLCLDIGTDLLPALALGAEAAGPRTLVGPADTRHLLDRSVLWRAFGVLGPTEALVEMALAMASGAAFAAVVLGQMANAFACRSTRLAPWRLDRPANDLLVVAVVVEAVLLVDALAKWMRARRLRTHPIAGMRR
jgi:magnesium-transporting ATPase (P-type)